LLDAVRESVNRYAWPLIVGDVKVVAGSLGERAEVLGAVDRLRGQALWQSRLLGHS
jgi:hypothetical protein